MEMQPKIAILILLIILLGGIFFLSKNHKNVSLSQALNPSSCDQSATTTDCSKFPIQATSSTYAVGTTTSVFNNFSFSYPGRLGAGTGWDSGWCPGVHQVHFGETDHQIAMATTSAPLCAVVFNQNAKVLADFEGGYSIANTFVERIHSQNYVTINGIRMLKQIYSQGPLNTDGTINSTIEYGVDHQLRYVFFDGRSFVMITAWKDEAGLDRIVQSIRLLNK